MKKIFVTLLLALISITASAQNFHGGVNRVSFQSEGETLIGDLYLPTNYKKGTRLTAIITVGPFTQVKEQVAGVYARKMAEAGFVALAFDFRFWGESGGKPRSFESPKDKITDIRNAVTYLSSLPIIDKDRIGLIGACFGAGYVTAAVAEDSRIKSWSTVAAWYNDEENLVKLFGGETLAYRDSLSVEAEKAYVQTGVMPYAPAYEPGNKKAAMFAKVDYYGNPKRGAIPAWNNQYALTSHKAWHAFNVWPLTGSITAPVLFVHSDSSSLPENVRRAYKEVKGPKELHWTTGEHTEFYDQPKQVNDASAAMVRHFKKTL